MGRPFRFSMLCTPRITYHVRWRLALVLFITALCHQQHLFFVHRQSLAAKYAATRFDMDQHGLRPTFERRGEGETTFQDELLASHDAWKVLGEGWEGKVFAYKGSVIKTFTPGRSPFRNCAPGIENEKWPTEIAATLRFGGYNHQLDNGDTAYNNVVNSTLDGFLPARAYFKASTSPARAPEWHLVTPLLRGGNLKTLAKKTALDPKMRTTTEIDSHYRPAFERLLGNMQRLHDLGYCHDDIKPANVFVEEDTKWLLGDLGNVRHTSHQYHSSSLWIDNGQLIDCRSNDVMRALKSYLQFVRMAVRKKQQFDERFFGVDEPLSRLFWQASADAPKMNAAQLQNLSFVETPRQTRQNEGSEISVSQSHALSSMLSHPWALRKAVDHAVETSMGEKLARWWAMVGILGVPNDESCGF